MRNHQEQGNRNHPHASICVIFAGMNDCFAGIVLHREVLFSGQGEPSGEFSSCT